MTVSRYPIALVAASVLVLAAGCAPGQSVAGWAAPTSAAPVPTDAAASPLANPPANPPVKPAANPPVKQAPNPPTKPAANPPAKAPVATQPVNVAIVESLTATLVIWHDGQFVKAQANNSTIVPVDGSDHEHKAPLAPNAKFFLPQDPADINSPFEVDDTYGVGTHPCTLSQMQDYVVGSDLNSPRLTFDSQGQVLTVSARWHP